MISPIQASENAVVLRQDDELGIGVGDEQRAADRFERAPGGVAVERRDDVEVEALVDGAEHRDQLVAVELPRDGATPDAHAFVDTARAVRGCGRGAACRRASAARAARRRAPCDRRPCPNRGLRSRNRGRFSARGPRSDRAGRPMPATRRSRGAAPSSAPATSTEPRQHGLVDRAAAGPPLPATSMVMPAVGANGAKSNVNLPPVGSSARASGSMVLPPRLMTRPVIVFFDPFATRDADRHAGALRFAVRRRRRRLAVLDHAPHFVGRPTCTA